MGEHRMTVLKAMAFGTSIATTLAGLVGGGFVLGSFLDQRLGTQPWLSLLFMILGLVLGGCYLVVTLRKFGVMDDKK
ncbi:MAG TPA: ATPase [Desulfitobacterium dehalogenans]|uniref:ATPase n=1 Tax=Desulfitobacterium dehalogenans TaxID=36854 RepID=A0A7C6Z506_9FIRM|nr:ATPase [Desulfitobacterium dehalogenans]